MLGRPQDFFSFLKPVRPALMIMLIVFVTAILSNKIKSIRTIRNNSQLKRYLFFCSNDRWHTFFYLSGDVF